MSEEVSPSGSGPALRPYRRATSAAMYAVYGAEYVLWLGIMGLFRMLGLRGASDFGGWLARTVGPRIPVTRRARRNMKRSIPGLTDEERENYIRQMWENLGRTFAEYAHLEKIWAVKPGARIEIIGMEHVNAAISKGRGGLFVSGHCGNWEVMPRCIADIGYKGTLVYRPPNNPFVDAWISRQRQIGLPTIAAKGGDGARSIIKTLREGDFLAILIDQKMNDGVSVPFFGRPAMTATGAPSLSVRHNSPIVPAWCERLPGQTFRVTAYPELKMPNTGDRAKDIYELALLLNQFVEARIRENPANWLWLHNRWPKD